MQPVHTSCFRRQLVGRGRALLLQWQCGIRTRTGGDVGLGWWVGRGCTTSVGCDDAVGSQPARFWVDERKRLNLVGWDMHTRSGRGGRGRVRREVGVRFDGSTGE